MSRSPFKSLSSAAMCCVVTLSASGLPLTHEADHDDDFAHIEHNHGGHGTVLLEQEERLLSKAFGFSATTTSMVLAWADPGTSRYSTIRSQSFDHPGRDPPGETRPRAPPILIS